MLAQRCRSYATPPKGGIVFEVAFGGVSDGAGTNCIGCARAKLVTYRRARRRSPRDAAEGPDLARVSAHLERRVGPDLTEDEVRLTRPEAPIWSE
jgi:hypothetical protein